MANLFRNLRGSFRQMRREPGLTIAVVLTLGLAIAASTAVFSFVNALLIRPFPFRDAEQLVEISSVRGGQTGRLSMREILDIKEQASVLEDIAGRTTDFGGYNFSGDGRPQEWKTVLITGNLFDVLGSPLAVGNTWPAEADRTRDNRVVLAYGTWLDAFAGADNVVGRKIVLDHAEGYYIDAVSQAGFDYPRGIQVYRSIGGFASNDKRDYRNLIAVARIRRPASALRLQAQLDAVARDLADRFPGTNAGLSFRAETFRDVYSGSARPYLLTILGAVLFVLFIGCGNVANLLLARGLARGRELAVRVSLGASRANLIAQILTESIVLSLTGAAAGLLLAIAAMKVLRALIGAQLPAWMPVEIDVRVLGFAIAVSLVSGILSGIIPALHSSRQSTAESLKEGGRGGSKGRGAQRLRDMLVVSEVALALVLLTGAGLLIRNFAALQAQEKGFRADSISTFRVALGWKRYGGQQTIAGYYERLLNLLRATPGVQGAALVTNPPLARQEESSRNNVQAEGQTVDEALRNPYVNWQSISDDYFRMMQIQLRAGRTFSEFDRTGSEPVAIVSERLAKQLWPGMDPLGRRILYDPLSRTQGAYRKVIGIAGNVQQRELGGEPGYDFYIPYLQQASANQYVLVRTRMPVRSFTAATELVARSIDSEQSVFDFKTYDDRILDSIWQLRLSRMLLTLFAGVALVLAAIGAYGVMSYMMEQRTREMGIRLALGATRGSIHSLVIRRAAAISAAGAVIGLCGAIVLGIVLRSLLPGVAAFDPWSTAASLGLLLAVTIAAGAIPSWIVSGLDPASTLRRES